MNNFKYILLMIFIMMPYVLISMIIVRYLDIDWYYWLMIGLLFGGIGCLLTEEILSMIKKD